MPNTDAKMTLARNVVAKLPTEGVIGIGSGTTVASFIQALGSSSISQQNYTFIAASYESEQFALKQNLPIQKYDGTHMLDLTIDGADFVIREQAILIKGKGGAFVREKILQNYSTKYWIILTEDKLTPPSLVPIPLEIIPFAWNFLSSTLKSFGHVALRKNVSQQPILSDNGNWIVDLTIPLQQNWIALHHSLNAFAGVIETGIFFPNQNQKTTLFVQTSMGKLQQLPL